MRLHGGQNHMQTCPFAYFQDMQVLDVTLYAKLLLCLLLRHMGTDLTLKDKLLLCISVRYLGTGCNLEGKVVP
jgi:hypothetical protein